MKTLGFLFLPLLLLFLAPAAWAQNVFIQGNALSNRTYNSDNGPTNSQLTLDFTNAQPGILQNILTWGETSGSSLSGIGQSFEVFVLRPLNSTNYQVVFGTGYLTVTNVGTNSFAVSGTPFGLRVGDVVAHYGRGIPFSNGTGGPSSVYIAVNLPPPVVGNTITVPSTTYPLYSDGGRNYAIQMQLLGQPFLVTTNSDNGPGSLRQAVLNANALGGTSTINFANFLSGQTILLTSGQIVLNTNITIDGSTLLGGIAINGNHASRIFNVGAGNVVLNSLTITNGSANNDSNGGGGIFNAGTLKLANCTLTGNSANNSFGGGGIFNYVATLTLASCTLSGNSANSCIEGGGGIENYAGTLMVIQCTISGNSADSSGHGGGGIMADAGTVMVTNSIIASNTAAGSHGADIFNESTVMFGGANLLQAAPYLFDGTVTGNYITAAPLLAPLGNYGGPTPTMPPLLGSPAIDAGAATMLTTDQRGFPRVAGAAVDIGAVEAGDAIPGYTYGTVVNTNSDFLNGLITNVVSLHNAATFAANNSTITFAPGLSGQTILLTGGQIVLNANLSIDASSLPGGIFLNGNHASRIFSVNGGTVVMNSLTLTNGTDAGHGGGGILNSATLTLTNCTLVGNTSSDNIESGGGIFNSNATLTVNNCFLANNSAQSGGGIYSDGYLTVNQSTLTGNSALAGGGIYFAGATMVINQSTLAGNTADENGEGAGGGIVSYGGTLFITNSIIAANTTDGSGADIFSYSGNLTFGGANLLQAAADNRFGTETGTYITAAPQLAPLGNNGGPTQTMPPLPGSPAIDAGAATTLTTDQRGFPRAVGPKVDIGAVEFQANPVVTAADVIAGSLRYAVSYVTNNSTITFAPSLSGQTITLTNGQITITNHLTIDGSALANGIRISGNHNSRIFYISNNATPVLNSLTILNGNGSGGDGGALYNAGNLILNQCTFTGNSAGSGGALKNASGSLILNECTFTGNATTGGGGGAIVNYALLLLNTCTLTTNSAGIFGGAIYNETGGTVNMNNSIAAGNSLVDFDNNGSLTLVGANIVQIIFGNSSIGTTPINANPLLAPLGNYGGPTPTMPPLPGSPAIDASGAATFTTDQRGYPRSVGLGPDIGAVEGAYTATGPGKITTITKLGNGSVQLSFTNVTDAVFPVLASTNLSQSLSNWTQIGFVTESPVGSGQFPFTDTQATNYPQRFYRIRSP